MSRPLRHFSFLTPAEDSRIFAHPPAALDSETPRSELAVALGATLYSPGTREHLDLDAARAARVGVTSQVWCLEDSVAHADVPAAETNVVDSLARVSAMDPTTTLPLLFVRVRTAEQVTSLAERAGSHLANLTGFVVPKVDSHTFGEFLGATQAASATAGKHLYILPVLETPELAWSETRRDELLRLRSVFDAERSRVLGVRVGATDFCGLFGLRRDRETTIWEVAPVRDILSDILNTFARRNDYAVSGPVWEHFSGPSRLFGNALRVTPFADGDALPLREALRADASDALVREVLLDRANGFSGKTVIHPSHVSVVNSLMSVTLEEYDDARLVVDNAGTGGVARSRATNKMNEFGPHALWAEGILERARVYGVLNHPHRLFDLIDAGRRAAAEAYPSSASLASVSVGAE